MHNTSSRYRIAVIALGTWASLAIAINPGCGPTPTTSPTTTASKSEMLVESSESCDLPAGRPSVATRIAIEARLVDGCQTSNCGGNSPTANRFPINGFKANCRNSQGVFLVPKSIGHAKRSCNNHTLGVRDNELVALDAPDCKPEDLNGATFIIKNKYNALSIQIHKINRHSYSNHDKESFPHYAFTIPQETGQSLCSRDGADVVHKTMNLYNHLFDKDHDKNSEYWPHEIANDDNRTIETNLDTKLTTDTLSSGSFSKEDVAIIVEGEVHGEDGSTIEKSKQGGWFNIACLNDALANVDLYGIASHKPDGDSDHYARRDAALKMITANYCDKDRYTYKGNEIEWQTRTAQGSWVPPMTGSPDSLEADWDQNGAVCLANSRLYKLSPTTDPIPDWIYPNDCYKTNKCRHNGNEFRGELNKLHKICGRIQACIPGTPGEQGVFFRSYSR